MKSMEELQAIEAALGTNLPEEPGEELIKASISWGYNPFQGRLGLLFDLQATQADKKLEAFAATLSYEPKGRGGCHEVRSAYASGTAMEVDLIRSTVSLVVPDRHPLEGSWEIIAMVNVGLNQSQPWVRRGKFHQP